jgi:hypothetical protein
MPDQNDDGSFGGAAVIDRDDPETEAGSGTTTDAELHQLILRVSSLIPKSERVAFIAEMREKMGDVEDDNPEAFKRLMLEEAKRQFGKRR